VTPAESPRIPAMRRHDSNLVSASFAGESVSKLQRSPSAMAVIPPSAKLSMSPTRRVKVQPAPFHLVAEHSQLSSGTNSPRQLHRWRSAEILPEGKPWSLTRKVSSPHLLSPTPVAQAPSGTLSDPNQPRPRELSADAASLDTSMLPTSRNGDLQLWAMREEMRCELRKHAQEHSNALLSLEALMMDEVRNCRKELQLCKEAIAEEGIQRDQLEARWIEGRVGCRASTSMSVQEDMVEGVIERQLEAQFGRITTENGPLDEIVERHLEAQLTSLRADLFDAFRELRVALDLSDASVPLFGDHDIVGMCARVASVNAMAPTSGAVRVPPLNVPPPLPEEDGSEAASTGCGKGNEATNTITDGLRAEVAEARSMLAEARDALVEARGLAHSWGSHDDGFHEIPVGSTEHQPSVADCLDVACGTVGMLPSCTTNGKVERTEFLSLQKDLAELREWVQAESETRVTALSRLQDVGVPSSGPSAVHAPSMFCKQGAAVAGAGSHAE